MKRQNLSNGKIILSFTREEYQHPNFQELINKLHELPEEVACEYGNKYNYLVDPSVISLTDNVEFGPFTREEWIEGEIEFLKFISQFEDNLI
jgi:hypothetical protein